MKISIRQKIINLLIREELTIGQISEKLDISKNHLSSYLDALKKAGKIEAVDNSRKPYIYEAITPKAYLKKLYDFMGDENKCIINIDNCEEKDLMLVKTIKEMFK